MIRETDDIPSVLPEVIITKQPSSNAKDDDVPLRSHSRERSSRSVSISRLKVNDPIRKELMFVREKSPFEIGDNRNVQVASSKAIIDKALIMDVSGGITKVDEYVSLFFSSGCVIDEAVCRHPNLSEEHDIEIIVIDDVDIDIPMTSAEQAEAITENIDASMTKVLLIEDPVQYMETKEKSGTNGVTDENQQNNLIIPEEITLTESTIQETTYQSTENMLTNQDMEHCMEETLQEIIEEKSDKTNVAETGISKTERPTETNNETEESSEEEEESSSDESFAELVDPSLWKAYDSNDEDDSEWFYKKPEDPTPELTEREKDDEFRKDRLAKRIPIFLTNLTDRSGATGSEVKLQCSIEGFGVTVKWMKDDNIIERSSKVRTTAVDGLYSLFIKHLEKSDEGIYTIIAKNRGAEVSSFARVKVYNDMKEKIEIPTIIKIRDYYHHALNDLIIECQIMSVPSNSIPDIMWLKDDDPLTFNNKIRATYEGNELFQLSIYNPTPDDSGVYTCIAKNSAGQRSITHEVEFTSKVHYIHLPGMHHADKKILSEEELMQKEIQAMELAQERATYKTNSRAQPSTEPYKEESYVIRDSKNKLKWAGQLSNQTVQKGQTVKMICSVIGNQAILKWQKNSKAIDFDSRVKLMNSGVIGQIVISDVSLKDAGEYVCHAKNNYNEIITSCVLKVIELPVAGVSPPMFIKAIKEFFNQQTNDLILETQVGTPNPEIQWYKDDEQIIYDDKYMLNRESNGRYQLRIHKPQSADCGMYECRAKNSDGQAKIKHEVKFNSNEQFVHAHRIEHVDRFKRNVVEDSTLSVSSEVLSQSAQSVVPIQEDQQHSLSNDQQNAIKPEATAQGNEIEEVDEPPKSIKPASAPKPKAMPRRHFNEGPVEPFIIRDSKKKLTWEAKIKNVTTAEGKDIKIVCIVAGPQPQFKWFKNGKPLVWSKNIVNATKGEFGCVVIKNASFEDNGEYTAQVKNSDSEIECSGTINVFTATKQIESAPTFTRVTDYYDIRVNDLVVEVQVRGIPCPTLIWERDGREFKNGMDRVIISREKDSVHKLSIHNPEKLDGGQWVITAVNSAGEEKVKHRVIFKGKEHCEYVPGIYHADCKTSRGHDEMVSVGRSRSASRAASVFSVRSQLNGNALPIAENELEQAILKDASLEHDENVSQKSKKPQKKEWRSKLSVLYNKDGIPTPQELNKPKISESKQKLHFEAQLKNMTAVQGNSVKLVCSCVGPSPSLKWFKNNIPIVWSKNVKNDSKLGVGAITIKNATESDSGEYKCVATNNFDEVATSCILSVFQISGNQYESPKFTKNVREYYNGTVNDLILEVQVRGNPPPTIKWFRDGIELQDTEGDKYFQMREPDGIHKLTIHDPQRMDEGRYMIEAENIAGKETVKHEIKKLNKEEYCHVYGIKYHDPTIKKHGAYEESSAEKPVNRKLREFVFMDDGSYYIRGQTPENLWEWETDTSAESEYEPYVPTSDDEIDTKEQEEDDDEKNTDNEEDNDEMDPEVPSEDLKTSSCIPKIIKRGPKIKKIRKKATRKQSPIILDVEIKDSQGSDTKKLFENEILPETKPLSDLEKDASRRERYHKLFPELIPEPCMLKPDKNALKFMTELRDVTVMEGASFRLFCTILGPKPDIKWLKNDEPMEFTKTVKNQTHDFTGIVNFSKASVSDEGLYTVTVKHKDCTISSQAKVKIVQKPVLTQGSAPRFITGINQHYDCRVDDLILETHIKGDGLLNVQWFLDGIEISNNEKYIQIREPLGVYKLCIHNPQIRDNGNYTVQVSNDYGVEELKYHLRLEGKQDKSCYGIFHADPRRQYKDEEVKEQRLYREVVFLEDGTYYVRGQTPEQFWEWETDTSAESEYEVIESESDHSPDENEDHEESDKEDKEASAIIEDDETIILQLDVNANQSEENQEEGYQEAADLKPKIIKRGPKIKKLRKKTYKPTQLPPQIQLGIKTDTIVAEKQTQQRISQKIQIDEPKDVVSKPKKKPIKVEFISHLRNQTLLKGKTLSLNCCCSDNTKIEVSWFKNGEKFEMNRRCVSDVHFGFITLEIYRTVLEDSGTYECFVKTSNGEAKDSCKITVFELPDKETVDLVPPTFLQPLKEIYHPTTNDLHLETRVRGNPVPTFTWICDGVFIHHSSDKYEIFNQHYYELGTKITTATLIINDPQMKDSGKYTLIAKNDVQSVEIFKQVKIGIRSEAHKKKRMDEVVIENDAPRVLPKPPTPEPVIENDKELTIDEKNAEDFSKSPGEDKQQAEEDDDDDWLNV